jgi:signal transduction histidine kinase
MLAGERGAALDMQVVTSPLALDGASVTLVSLRDISAEKRRRVLERVFFHDVLNTAGAMLGVTRLLADAADADADKQYRDMLVGQCENLIEEIKSQKQLVQAETGELETNPLTIPVLAVLRSVHGSYASHEVAAGRHLVIGQVAGCKVESDVPLLRRVLGNLVKNALEATPVGGTVTLWADDDGEHVVFHVNNPGRMPERVRLQIFQRSFSTKGPGRGIGTYSIRLLGERYLGGRVELTTSGGEGTTFRLRIPKRWKAPAV